MGLTLSSEGHICPRAHSYCCQKEHRQYPGCLPPCSSCLQQQGWNKHQTSVVISACSQIRLWTSRSACTHCRRKARTRTGVAPRRAWPCACRPGGRRPRSAPGRLPSGICISTAAGGMSRPSLPIWRRNGKEFGRQGALPSKHSRHNVKIAA